MRLTIPVCESTFVYDLEDLDGLRTYLESIDLAEAPEEVRDLVKANWPDLLSKLVPPFHERH